MISVGVRHLSRELDKANETAQEREAALGTRRAQLEEFRRLHDEAIQVFERTSAGDEPISPQLRAYARQSADHLRATMASTAAQSSSLRPRNRGKPCLRLLDCGVVRGHDSNGTVTFVDQNGGPDWGKNSLPVGGTKMPDSPWYMGARILGWLRAPQ